MRTARPMQAMRDIVAKCLVKDPTKRPSAAQLLEHKFFKTAHEPGYLVKHLLAGLPPLTDRVQIMRTGRAPAGHTIVENRDMAAQSQVSLQQHTQALGTACVILQTDMCGEITSGVVLM